MMNKAPIKDESRGGREQTFYQRPFTTSVVDVSKQNITGFKNGGYCDRFHDQIFYEQYESGSLLKRSH